MREAFRRPEVAPAGPFAASAPFTPFLTASASGRAALAAVDAAVRVLLLGFLGMVAGR